MAALAIVTDKRVPRELLCSRERETGARLVVPVDGSTLDAARADWVRDGEVELVLDGRVLVLQADLNGRGVRVIDPFGRLLLAVFRPARRGRGTVVFADGAAARWIAPDRWSFECGFVSPRGNNLVRFAHDGTAIMLVDEVDHEAGLAPDPVVMLALGWFLLWVGLAPRAGSPHVPAPRAGGSADPLPLESGRSRDAAGSGPRRGHAA
jgi:hypothetical protein